MPESDPRVVSALRRQLEDWHASLEAGADRVGWKIGLNVPAVQEKLGLHEPVIGHLTSASELEDGAHFAAAGAANLRVEPEVALHMGSGGAIAGFGAAIELVDPADPPPELEVIVADNVFHQGFLLGPVGPQLPSEGVTAAVLVNGESRATGAAPKSFAEVTELVARLLAEAGDQLREGDVIIAGSLTAPVPVTAGDEVRVVLTGLGALSVSIV